MIYLAHFYGVNGATEWDLLMLVGVLMLVPIGGAFIGYLSERFGQNE